MEEKKYDLVIIGAGPAGLSAAVYGVRAGLELVVLEKAPMSGGQVLNTYEVDNYLGIPGIKPGFDMGCSFGAARRQAGGGISGGGCKKYYQREGTLCHRNRQGKAVGEVGCLWGRGRARKIGEFPERIPLPDTAFPIAQPVTALSSEERKWQ